jgi:hypothetical protein
MSDLIANAPSPEVAAKLAASAPKPKRVPITQYVRVAVVASLKDEDHYTILAEHFSNGRITGSAHADVYRLAELLVEWEAKAERFELSNAMSAKGSKVRLVDIVKRITPELRKLGFDVMRGTILGICQDTVGADSESSEAA